MTDDVGNEATDIFDDDASQVVQSIMLMRIYDMLTCIARGVNPTEAQAVFEAHSMGKILGPAPSFDMADEVSETNEVEDHMADGIDDV
jgi:hypothetical protein